MKLALEAGVCSHIGSSVRENPLLAVESGPAPERTKARLGFVWFNLRSIFVIKSALDRILISAESSPGDDIHGRAAFRLAFLCKYRLCSDVEFHAWTRCRQLSPVPRNLLKPLIFGYLPSFTPSPDHHALKAR